MFAYADKDKDGKISYTEFQTMINPPRPPTEPQPYLTPAPAVKKVTIKTKDDDDKPFGRTDTEQLEDTETTVQSNN